MLAVRVGVVDAADGSAEVQMGGAKALAVVSGPMALPSKSFREFIDRATVQVTVNPYASPPGIWETAGAEQLSQLLEAAIVTRLHPRALVQIQLQPLNSQAALMIPLLFNAAIAALLEACIPLSHVPMAVGGRDQWAIVSEPNGVLYNWNYPDESIPRDAVAEMRRTLKAEIGRHVRTHTVF